MSEQQPITALAKPHPLTHEWIEAGFPHGLTVAEILGPEAVSCRVEIGGVEIPEAYWTHVRPRPGSALVITRFPQGGNGGYKDILRLVAFAALSAFTSGISTGFIFGLKGIAAYALAAAVGIVGSLLINALIPPTKPKGPADTSFNSLKSISGSSNRANPFGAVPCVLGTIRFFPTLAALPFAELSGDDQYARFLFDLGYGDCAVSVMQIGDTDLASFTAVETDISLTPALFSDDITENTASVVLNTDGSQQVRTSDINADELAVDLVFPSGLFGVDKKGKAIQVTCSVRIEQSPAGSGLWAALASVPVTQQTISNPAAVPFADVFNISSAARKVLRVGIRWNPGAVGQYDVRVTRVSTNWGAADPTNGRIGDLTWAIIRTIRHTNPSTTGTKKLAMRIKATDQLNGSINQFNCIAAQPIPVWNGTAWVTDTTGNDNPAAVFRWVLRDSPANPRVVDPTRIDDAALQDWFTECTAKEFTFSTVQDQPTTVFELLRDICAAGRASFTVRDGKYSVVRDVAQSTPIQHFSPRNSWGFQGHRSFVDQVHALRCQFIDPEANYQQDEIVVYDDGFSADGSGGTALATKFETFQIRGCTNANGAWRLGRYHLAVARLRPNTYTWNCDIENLVCQRGDLVRFAHDIVSVGLAWGRIKGVTTDVNGNATSITVDEPVRIDGVSSYAVRIRGNDNSSKVTDVNTGTRIQTTGGATDSRKYLFTGPATVAGDTLHAEVTVTNNGLTTARVDIHQGLAVVLVQPGETVKAVLDQTATGAIYDMIFGVANAGDDMDLIVSSPLMLQNGVNLNVPTLFTGAGWGALGTAVATITQDPITGDGISVLNLTMPQPGVNPGDLFLFGLSGQESQEMIISKIEPGSNFSARLTAVDSAPAVLTADSGTPPPFVSSITGIAWVDTPPPPDLIFTISQEPQSPFNDGGVGGPVLNVGIGPPPSGRVRTPVLDRL